MRGKAGRAPRLSGSTINSPRKGEGIKSPRKGEGAAYVCVRPRAPSCLGGSDVRSPLKGESAVCEKESCAKESCLAASDVLKTHVCVWSTRLGVKHKQGARRGCHRLPVAFAQQKACIPFKEGVLISCPKKTTLESPHKSPACRHACLV